MGLSVFDKKQKVDTKSIVGQVFGDVSIESIPSDAERPNTSQIVQSVFDGIGQFSPAAESLGVAGLPREAQAPRNPLLKQFKEGTPDVTAPAAAVGGFIAGAIPFLDKIPGLREKFNKARETFPKSFGAGEVTGTFIPGAAALKGAKVLLKPLVKQALPLIKSSKKAIQLLTQAGIAVSEGVLADLFFSAVSVEKPSVKSMAAFAAVDAVLPGLGAIVKKLKVGRQIKQDVKTGIKTVLPEKPSAIRKTEVAPTAKAEVRAATPVKFEGIPNVLVEKAQKVSKEDFVTSTFEIPLNELKTLVTQAEIIAKSRGHRIKSRTPDAPIVMGFRDGKVVILDGNNRYFEKLNSGAKTIKARFAFNEGEENLFDLINRTTKKGLVPVKPVVIAKPVTLSEALENKPFQVTSARKADIAKFREEIGVKALNTPERKAWDKSLRNAKEKGIPDDALRLADEINKTPRSFNDEETAGLVIKLSDLKSKYSKLNLENAKLTDLTEIKLKSAEIERLEDEFNTIHSALKKSGTEKGRTLAAQKLTIDQDFDLIAVKQRARAAVGKPLDEKQSKQFKGMVDRLDARAEQVKQLEKQLAEAQARGAVVGRRNKFQGMSAAQKDTELSSLVSKAKKLIDDGCQVIA